MEKNKINEILSKLNKSKFRSKFQLSSKDIDYIQQKGLDTIKKHTEDFISKRLSNAIIENDGKQTPMHGHPTFIAQHATATCCRKCLYKWHHIKQNKDLTSEEKEYVTKVIMTWINNQIIR